MIYAFYCYSKNYKLILKMLKKYAVLPSVSFASPSIFCTLMILIILPFLLRGQNTHDLQRVFYTFQKNTAGNPPYENPLVGGFNCPEFSEVDLNNDGKLDLFVFDRIGYACVTYLNVNNKYVFSPEYLDNFPKLNDWALLRDFDGDGIAIFSPSMMEQSVVYAYLKAKW